MANENLETYIGKIERIYNNVTQTGKGYRVFEILQEDGERTIRYFVWDKKIGLDLKQGDAIKYEWKQKGDFRIITSVEMVKQSVENKEPETKDATKAYQEQMYSNYMTERERMIVRSVSLKSASKILSNLSAKANLEEKVEDVIRIATRFEQYLLEIYQSNNKNTQSNDGSKNDDDLPF